MTPLYERSVELMKAAQAASGAIIACPNFPAYRYCWFRDGSFAAHALALAGETEAAHRFHHWAARTLLAHREDAAMAIGAAWHEELPARCLQARYTLHGSRDGQEWPNFQLDGLGIWLWSAREHLRLSGASPPGEWMAAFELIAEYLDALWDSPCFDLWEEFGHRRHTSTLGAIAGGLQAVAGWLPRAAATAEAVRHAIRTRGVDGQRFTKFLDGDGLDASILGLAVPFGVVEPHDPLMVATVEAIEASLRAPGGGVWRYREDTFFGGGEWVLLTAWLGWFHAQSGNRRRAAEALAWVEAQADGRTLELPEQVGGQVRNPLKHAEWLDRWGPIARPLTWSHAMYVILRSVLC